MKYLKGWRTVLMGFAIAVGPLALQYLAGVDWTQLISPKYIPFVTGAVMIALRVVTTTGIGKRL